MPNYRRPKPRGGSVFFTVCLAQRGSRLLIDEIDILREAVQTTRARRPFHIDAWVVLPDHMHTVWTLPEDDPSFSQRWGMIKARFSKHVRLAGRAPTVPDFGAGGGVNPALRKGEVGIWQRRFWEHHIRDRADYDAHVSYCLLNPVRHGLVDRPEEWEFSSIHRDIRQGRRAA